MPDLKTSPLAYRDYHSLSHARPDPYSGLPPLEFRSKGIFTADPQWYYDIEYPEETRLKYRFLDLRRERLHRNITLRSKVISSIRRRATSSPF